MQLSRLKTLLEIKLLVLIIFNNVANESKDKLIEEDTHFNKLSFIIFGQLLGTGLYQDATNFDLNK